MKQITQKGSISIVLSVMLLSVILVITSGIAGLMLNQIIASKHIGHSVVALYAAESGIERCYYDSRRDYAASCAYIDIPLDFDSNATYTVDDNSFPPMDSIGNFYDTNRKLEVTW